MQGCETARRPSRRPAGAASCETGKGTRPPSLRRPLLDTPPAACRAAQRAATRSAPCRSAVVRGVQHCTARRALPPAVACEFTRCRCRSPSQQSAASTKREAMPARSCASVAQSVRALSNPPAPPKADPEGEEASSDASEKQSHTGGRARARSPCGRAERAERTRKWSSHARCTGAPRACLVGRSVQHCSSQQAVVRLRPSVALCRSVTGTPWPAGRACLHGLVRVYRRLAAVPDQPHTEGGRPAAAAPEAPAGLLCAARRTTAAPCAVGTACSGRMAPSMRAPLTLPNHAPPCSLSRSLSRSSQFERRQVAALVAGDR